VAIGTPAKSANQRSAAEEERECFQTGTNSVQSYEFQNHLST
jgi:hypothetical protein